MKLSIATGTVPPEKRKWPKYVKERKTKITYRPKIPASKRHLVTVDKQGCLLPTITLGKPTDPEALILERYNQAVAAVEAMLNPKADDYGTLNWLFGQYQNSRPFNEISTDTQKDYKAKLTKLLSFPVEINDTPSTVGNIPLQALSSPAIRTLMDEMLDTYHKQGLKGNSIVNGMIRCLSAMLSYCVQYFSDVGLSQNPCLGVRKYKETTIDRYVTDHEYYVQLEFACSKGADYLPVFFEHAYMLASRSIEIRNLELDDVDQDFGYVVDRRKGSKMTIIEWVPRLRMAYEAAIRLRKKRKPEVQRSNKLILGQAGEIKREALKSAMSRLKKDMKEAGLEKVFWTLHDLKRKGISDAESDDIAGHKTEAMKARYHTRIESYRPPTKGLDRQPARHHLNVRKS